MRILLLILLILPFQYTCNAQETSYAVSLVDTTLLKDANAIGRMEEMNLKIKDIGKATLYRKYAITILNEAGEEFADFSEYYDKFQAINYIEGKLFDAAGKKIRTMKKNELSDISFYGSGNMIDDNRQKVHNFNCRLYPYTIEYESSIDLNGILFFPTWIPVPGYNFSVENSILTVEYPADYQLRHKSFNYYDQPIISGSSGTKISKWHVKGVMASTKEQFSPPYYEITPTVTLAPANFEIDGYKGSMNSWKDLGLFNYELNKGRDNLPDNIKNVVHQLTESLRDPHEKIKVLYEYLQKNTRYVSIQLGIGGWQTFDAKYVANKGYGDCKALSNYMYAILKEAGIRSQYALIKAGDGKTYFLDDFPSNQFNHMIVCVPLPKDTVWLECTSQTLSAGYLSAFTADRSVLLIDEYGGKLVRTPKYGMHDNFQKRKIIAQIDAEGNLTATVSTQYKAIQQDNVHDIINGLSKDKIMEYLKNEIDLPTYDVVKFDYKEDHAMIPSVFEQLELTSMNYAQVTGKRLFINPNILTHARMKLKAEVERKTNIKLPYEYMDIDTVEINVPSGYQAESIPPDINIDSKFGKYHASVKVSDGKIIYYRTREQWRDSFLAKDYAELVKLYQQVYKGDRTKIVLVKKQE